METNKTRHFSTSTEGDYIYGITKKPDTNSVSIQVKNESDIIYFVVEGEKAYLKSSIDKIECPMYANDQFNVPDDVVYVATDGCKYITSSKRIFYKQKNGQKELFFFSNNNREYKNIYSHGKRYFNYDKNIEGFMPASNYTIVCNDENKFNEFVKTAQNG